MRQSNTLAAAQQLGNEFAHLVCWASTCTGTTPKQSAWAKACRTCYKARKHGTGWLTVM
jgi:hypothetical protein